MYRSRYFLCILCGNSGHNGDLYDQLGSINWQTIGALDVALAYFEEIGFDEIRERIFKLTDHLIEGLKALPVEIVSPIETRDERSAIVSFKAGGRSAECVQYLRKRGIHTACRNNCVRVAVNVFNDEEDIDCLLESLASFLSMPY